MQILRTGVKVEGGGVLGCREPILNGRRQEEPIRMWMVLLKEQFDYNSSIIFNRMSFQTHSFSLKFRFF